MGNVTNWIYLLREYFGDTIYTIVLCVFALFLILKCKKDVVKKIVVACIAFLLAYPLVYKICDMVSLDSVAYRLLWVFPLSIIVAVLLIAIVEKNSKKRIVGILLLFVVVLLFGNVGLQADAWNIPDNLYMLDDEVVMIGNAIEEDSEEERILVVGELDFMAQICQYSSRMLWAYKDRKYMMYADSSHTENASYRIAGAIQNHYYPDGMDIVSDLRELEVDYVVIYQDNPLMDYLSYDFYDIIWENENYKIIRLKL